jgi:hypothetical protein
MPTISKDRAPSAPAARPAPKLERTTFRTSREMDFFNEKELVTQTGHPRNEWPLVIVKELLDNALDACEEADIAPAVTVTADPAGITVTDNGPGLAEATLQGALDFTVRVSNREAYVSPCRGAQGNALKTLLPMPSVLDPEGGKLVVTSNGRRHEIACRADPISQRPAITDDAQDLAGRKTSGTSVRLEWRPKEAKGFDRMAEPWELWAFFLGHCFPATLYALVEGFALFNPHAAITLDWFGKHTSWPATDLTWKKWKPHQPTSSHWYEQWHLERLLGAYITHERDAGTDRLVSEFLAEFDGLAGSAKRTKVLTEAGLKRARLSEFVRDGCLDGDRVRLLREALRRHTKPVTPQRLGMIGEDHLRQRLLAMGVTPESFRYERRLSNRKSKNSQPGENGKAYALRSCRGC